MSVINKAKKELKKTLKKFEQAGGLHIFYNYNGKKFKPIVIGKSEQDIERKMRSKLEKKPDKYKNAILVKIYIQEIDTYFTNNDPRFFVGPLGINVIVYQIEQLSKYDLSLEIDNQKRLATFQYTPEELAEGFSNNHVILAMKAVLRKKVDNELFKIYTITDLLKAMKKKI